MKIDTDITLWETKPLLVNYRGPLQFKFRLPNDLPGPSQGKIKVRLPRRSVYEILGGFGNNAGKLVCQLKNILTHE